MPSDPKTGNLAGPTPSAPSPTAPPTTTPDTQPLAPAPGPETSTPPPPPLSTRPKEEETSEGEEMVEDVVSGHNDKSAGSPVNAILTVVLIVLIIGIIGAVLWLLKPWEPGFSFSDIGSIFSDLF